MKKATKGFSLIAAVFIVAVLALIAVYIVKVVALTISTTNLSILGERAYYAAKSGLEWGTEQMVAAAPNAPCFSATVINLNQAALAGFTATVSCTSLTVTDGGLYTVYTITSIGQKGTIGGQDYVSRNLTSQVIQ